MKLDDVNLQGVSLETFLKQYNSANYDRPSVTVDMAVFCFGNKLLMIKRKNHPSCGAWALPGGFLDMGETLHQAAERELMEETGVKNIQLHSLGLYAEPTRDPRTRIITAAFCAMIDEKITAKAGDDAAKAEFFTAKLNKINDVNIESKKENFPNISTPCTATGEKPSGIAQGFELTLTNKTATLTARLAKKDGVSILLDGGEISADHALIIFDALNKLQL